MYVAPLSNCVPVAEPSLILEISIHAQDYRKEDVEHGNHSRIRETSSPINVVETLEAEFKAQRGQIIVSRKCPHSRYGTVDALTFLLS